MSSENLKERAKNLLTTKSGIFLMLILFILLLVVFNDSSPEPAPDNQVTVPETSVSDSKIAMDVKSQVVKKVDGKCRYFFDIRNNGTGSFSGKISLSLFNGRSTSPLAKETFQTETPIEPTVGKSVYLDANTCPVSEHGEYGITKFQYLIETDGAQAISREGVITGNLFE